MSGFFSNLIGNTEKGTGWLVGQGIKAVGQGAYNFGSGIGSAFNSQPQSPKVTSKGISGASDAVVPPQVAIDSQKIKNGTFNSSISSGGTSKPTQPIVNSSSVPAQPVTPTSSYSTTSTGQQIPVSPGNSAPVSPQYAQGTPQPNDSTNPFINSVNTQQNYASGQGTQQVNTAQSGLQGIAQNQTPAVIQAQEDLANFRQASPFMLSDVRNNPNVAAEVSVGRGQALGQTLSAEEAAKSNTLSAALAGEGQQITAGNEAGQMAQAQQGAQQASAANVGSLTQPQAGASYFGSPVSGGVVGQGNNLVNTAVSQAIQLVQNGADPTQVLSQLTSAYGAGSPAVVAFQQTMLNKTGGTYNPTAASASSQQTASQGAQTGGEAYNLGIALKQVDTIKPIISNFLSSAKINSTDSPLYNEQINSYIGQLGNPAAVQQFNTMMNDLQNFSSQIIASGTALTPTGVTAAQALQDPSKLSMKQIGYYMDTLSTLGNNRLSVLQSSAKNSGYTGYMGSQANTQNSTQVAPKGTAPGSEITNQVGQGAAGAGLGLIGGIEGAANSALGWAAAILK